MKQRTSFAWLLALAFGGVLTFSSCKDNDVTSNGGFTLEEQIDKGSERAEALLSVLSMTAGVDSLPNDWYKSDYTVEPTVGKVIDASNPYVRYVPVSSVEEADKMYKSMISGNVTGSVTGDVWTKDGIGTLTFTVKNQLDVTATVDVKVNQLPHLTQIRFVPPSVIGENGSSFTPYYHFGDVVKLKADNSFWICVRPTNSVLGKNLSHWVSLRTNGSGVETNPNFKTYITKKGETLTLPYDLGGKSGSEEHICDFFYLYKALLENCRTSEEQEQQKRPQVKDSLYLIGEVGLLPDTALAISDFWREKGFWDSNGTMLMPDAVRKVLDTKINSWDENQVMDVFYFGHHYWLNPDVHMLRITGECFENTAKAEIKFTVPAGSVSFADYAKTGQSTDCSNLVVKTEGAELPEQAFVVRYKSGPKLSGKSDFWGNDKDPSNSFESYSDLVEDFYVYTKEKRKKDEECGYFVIGDQVTKDSKQMVCVKSSVGGYNTSRRSLFVEMDENAAGEPMGIEQEEARVIAFNLLNAFLLKNNLFEAEHLNSLGENYKVTLEQLAARLEDLKKIYSGNLVFGKNLSSDYGLYTLFYINDNGKVKSLAYDVSYIAATGEYRFHKIEKEDSASKEIRVNAYKDVDNKKQDFVEDKDIIYSTKYNRSQAQIEATDCYKNCKKAAFSD